MEIAISNGKHSRTGEVERINIMKNPTFFGLEWGDSEPVIVRAVVSTKKQKHGLF
jgi:hypothetical protein